MKALNIKMIKQYLAFASALVLAVSVWGSCVVDMPKAHAAAVSCTITDGVIVFGTGTDCDTALSDTGGESGTSEYSITGPQTLTGDLIIPAGVIVTVNGALTVAAGGAITGTGSIMAGSSAKLIRTGTGTIADTIVKTGTFDADSTDVACVAGTTPGSSNGLPANSVSCDVIINAVVNETISLGVSAGSVTIPSPVLGSSNNVAISASALEAKIDTNSGDGAKLMIRGSGTGTCTTSLTSLCNGNATTLAVSGNPAAPAYFGTAPTASSWGYNVQAIANSAIGTAGVPSTLALPTQGTPNTGAQWVGVTDTDTNVFTATPTGWNQPIDSAAFFATEVGTDITARHAFFYFAQQIAATTASGTYQGKVTLTAVPNA